MPRDSDDSALDAATAPRATVGRGLTVISRKQSLSALASNDPEAPSLITNLPTGTPHGDALLFKAVSTPDFDPAKIPGQVFSAVHFLATRATVLEESTEQLKDVVRITLYDNKGRTMAFTSWAAVRFVEMAILARGSLPWNPPVEFIVSMERAGQNKTTYGFQLVEPQ